MVTVCATFQLNEVKVSKAVEALASTALLTLTAIVTLAVGAVFRLTVKLAPPPASVSAPLTAETLMAGAPLLATTLVASSEVSPKLPPPRSCVAVAVTTWPVVTLTPFSTAAKLALPLPSVVTLVLPSSTAASPWPLASATGALKNSTR